MQTTPAPPVFAAEIRRLVLEGAYAAGVGHIGSALCIADVLAALYGHALRIDQPEDPDRDRFVLSKGHGALALYAAPETTGDVDLVVGLYSERARSPLPVPSRPSRPGLRLATFSVMSGVCGPLRADLRATGVSGADAAMASTVSDRLEADEVVGPLRIGVDVFESVVTLCDDETSQDERDRAVAIARRIAGVSEVVDSMR